MVTYLHRQIYFTGYIPTLLSIFKQVLLNERQSYKPVVYTQNSKYNNIRVVITTQYFQISSKNLRNIDHRTDSNQKDQFCNCQLPSFVISFNNTFTCAFLCVQIRIRQVGNNQTMFSDDIDCDSIFIFQHQQASTFLITR